MRGCLCLFLLCLSCGRMPLLGHVPAGDAAATDAATAAEEVGADLAGDSVPACKSLSLARLPDPSVLSCPPSLTTPECASSDRDAVVVRSSACLRSWEVVPFQCAVWPSPPIGDELILLRAQSCADTITINRALRCADHIEIDYTDDTGCEPCRKDGSSWRLFTLPLDSLPVIATSTYAPHPCLAPGP